MGSGVTWEKEEDEALAQSRVAASEDSITGTGQKASKFWGWVFEIYVGLIPAGWQGADVNSMHGSMGNDKSRCHKVLRTFCTGDKCSKIGIDGG
jgi:hypothetical protein